MTGQSELILIQNSNLNYASEEITHGAKDSMVKFNWQHLLNAFLSVT